MADYTPTTDVFKTFIHSLERTQDRKRQRQQDAANAAKEKLAQDLTKARFDIDLRRGSGNYITGLEDYQKGMERVGQYDVNQDSRTLDQVLGGYAPPLPTSTTPATARVPITIPSQAPIGQPYAQMGASEEQVAQALGDKAQQITPDLERYKQGFENLSTAVQTLMLDPTTGGTRLVYSPSFGKAAISPMSPKTDTATRPGGRSYVDPKSIEAIVDAAHAGQIDIKSATSKYQAAQIYGRWLQKYPEDRPHIVEMQARSGFRMQAKTQQTLSIIDSVIKPTIKEDGTIEASLMDQLLEEHVKLAQSGGKIWSKSANEIRVWLKEQQRNPHLTAFKQLQTALTNEIASAFAAGGVPTDMRFKNEILNLDPAQSTESLTAALDKSVAGLYARQYQFQRTGVPKKLKDPNVRLNELVKEGKTETEAYMIMAQEGYK